jgi:phosphoglycerate dehydrogenase-like enzyme
MVPKARSYTVRVGRIISSVALDVFEVEPLPRSSPLRQLPRCIFGSHKPLGATDIVNVYALYFFLQSGTARAF